MAASGPPLVLLHGGLVDSRAWRREIATFSDEFQVVAWDAPGCGRSSDPPPDASLDEYAGIAAGLADALELGPAHVLGHSFGGGLALVPMVNAFAGAGHDVNVAAADDLDDEVRALLHRVSAETEARG